MSDWVRQTARNTTTTFPTDIACIEIREIRGIFQKLSITGMAVEAINE